MLNARGGREVSVLRKADMKVVACYSEAKESYPGVLVDTRSKKIWTGKPEETEAQPQVAESQASGRGGDGNKPGRFRRWD